VSILNEENLMKSPFSNLLSWYFTRRTIPYWTVVFADSLIVLFATLMVLMAANGVIATFASGTHLVLLLIAYLLLYMVGFRLFHTYSGIIRYSTFVDLQRLLYAVGVSTVLLLPLQYYLLNKLIRVPLSDVIGLAVIILAMLWAERILVKYLFETTIRPDSRQKVFIYGVKHGGVTLMQSIENSSSPYKVVGFISDNEFIEHKKLAGIEVYNNDEYVVAHMKQKGATILMVSPQKNDRLRENDTMINRLIEAGIHIYMTPPAREYGQHEDLGYKSLHQVDVEDLLPRERIEIDMVAVGNLLQGKKILITGAAGSIGSEMVRQIAPFAPAELILVDQAETPLHDIRLMMKERWPEITAPTLIADISNAHRMEEIFSRHRPDYVFHAAAYKHVPMMEDNPVESIVNNVEGTRIIADAAVKYGAKKFVMISTDKAVNPTNVMGCSKRICEIYVQSLDSAIKAGKVQGVTQFVTTRFGNVLGSNGSVIPLFEKQIAAGGPITVTHPNIIRFFMLIPEACKLVLEAGTMGNGGEIFVFDMGKPVRIADLAKRMIKLSGATNVEIKYTGLRDGEKLYEEVLNDEEQTLPTFHQKIKIAKVRQYDYLEANVEIGKLVAAAQQNVDDMTLVAAMKQIVPEFKSQHSIYERLDHPGANV
jgi:FlaA1/EpsC-like NDP-sugar epimerase